MKHLLTTALAAAALLALAASACDNSAKGSSDRLSLAEQAFNADKLEAAQRMADSLLLASDLSEMSVAELCRLSTLFMRLSDAGTEQEINTAYAAHTLAEAYRRDPDSTAQIIAASPVDDRAAMALITAINEASHGIIIDGDTIFLESDSVPDEE